MMSATLYMSPSSRAQSRLCALLPTNLALALPFHPQWNGSLDPETALEAFRAAGVTTLELNLPPLLGPRDLAAWRLLVAHAQPNFTLHVHAPLAPTSSAWPLVYELLEQIAAGQPQPPILVIHAPALSSPRSAMSQTIAWLTDLVDAVPLPSKIALELGWNWGATIGLRPAWRRWRQQSENRTRRQRQGVGNGLGIPATQSSAAVSPPAPLDPDLNVGWPARLKRQGGYSTAGTREAVLALIQGCGSPRLSIAWDVAHDWLGGPWSQQPWTSVPGSEFLASVGYVRLHDVADDGTDHQPLVVGNVPYTTQLRSLLQAGFDGPVCLALRYTAHTARFGTRSQVQAQSLAIARRALRLHIIE